MYELTAFIGVGPAPSATVLLPQGAWLLPLLDDPLPGAAEELSLRGPVAYVDAAFFGGTGGQSARLYRDGCVAADFGDSHGYGAINQALAALGITAEPGSDAFDTLRLGRYRRTEQWLNEITPSPPSPSA